jgi:hypothetical protein
MDTIAALNLIRPGAQWSLNGDDYAGLVWLDDSPMPTQEEIAEAIPAATAIAANDRSRAARLAAFRDEADPLFFGWQRGENTEQEWLDKCEEIRQRFPYVPVPPLSRT